MLALGIPAIFIGVFVLGPLIARPVARFVGWPLPRIKGMTGTLARENASRNPKRTARTAAALMIGVSLVAGISVLAASIKSSVRNIFTEQFTGDFVINSDASNAGGGLPPEVAQKANQLPGVAAASGIELGIGRVNGTTETLSVVDPATAGKVFDLKFLTGNLEGLTADGVMISKDTADSKHLQVGSPLTLQLLNGSQHPVTVQGIYDKDELAGAYTISQALYAQSGADQYDFSVFVKKAPGASDAQVQSELDGLVKDYPIGKVQSRAQYIDEQASQIDTIVNLFYGLLFLAVIIAVVGIANTLSLSVYERTRELGLVRAVGATRRQVRGSVRWESVITALLGAAQGILIGVLLGYAFILALRDQGLKSFTIPVASLIVVVVLAFVCGVVAAIRPARRAARLDVLRAIASE
jgi:putative ABC transport system permease protein